ncbi:ATP-binding protein [Streptomyces sp. MST-110588]|uniref:ATP-binding protein n=1 Tax=Streptomyces sp. MST-110588 TaxID=2833628 RepID=UPI001F5DEBE0|nr:ATP-binding protein [Streptomyces sp. MST-110588]UNO44335.1 ATP-binding protein [Streptomyces sp. MST-110588]
MPPGPPAEPPEDLASPLAHEGVRRFTVPALESSVPRARHAVRDLLKRRRVPAADSIKDSLLLIVSELVTNAVQHAALLSPEIVLEITVGANWVRVAVEDNHPYRPKALQANEEDIGGRGLWLVKMLTVEAGGKCDVEHTVSGGKAVWAELPLTPVPTSPPPHL